MVKKCECLIGYERETEVQMESTEQDSSNEFPEWLPDEYDPEAPLAERLSVIHDIEGEIELHVRGENGERQVVGAPQIFYDRGSYVQLCCGNAFDDWEWEIVVSKERGDTARLEKVNPDQDIELYEGTKMTYLNNIDVRIYGVDVDRF